jgi:hypothetical protein
MKLSKQEMEIFPNFWSSDQKTSLTAYYKTVPTAHNDLINSNPQQLIEKSVKSLLNLLVSIWNKHY